MELAHSRYNETDGERGTNGMSRQREGREEAVCQGRRAALFLQPSATQGLIQFPEGGGLKGLVDLNYQDLHGNDDCLFMLAEWEGCKSLPERPADPLLDGRSLSWIKLWQDFPKSLLQLHKCPLST